MHGPVVDDFVTWFQDAFFNTKCIPSQFHSPELNLENKLFGMTNPVIGTFYKMT